MSESGHANEAFAASSEARRSGIRDGVVLTLVLYTLVGASEALAGDAPPVAGAAARPHTNDLSQPTPSAPAPMSLPLSLPSNFAAPAAFDFQPFSATEFRPRVHNSALAGSTRASSLGIEPSLFESSSVWEQMAQSRSADRVRLLTLWQNRASSLSLQAKRGGPSLQWSSPWMMRDRASRGLLDRWVPMPFRAGPGTAARIGPSRPASSTATPRTFESPTGVATK
jgi:hypothetical protein